MRFDITPLHPGGLQFGFSGLGVLANLIPATGDDGPSFGYPSVEPDDAGSELQFKVTRFPSGGDYFFYEDSSFRYTGPSDSFDFTKCKNGVADGTGTVYLNTGMVLVHADFPQAYEIKAVIAPLLTADFAQSYLILSPPVIEPPSGAISVSPSCTVIFDGGTNRVAFDGGTNRVSF